MSFQLTQPKSSMRGLDPLSVKVERSASAPRAESASSCLSEATSATSLSSTSSSSSSTTEDVLLELLYQIGVHDLEGVSIQAVSSEMAFCNSVYRVEMTDADNRRNIGSGSSSITTTATYFAKIFSPLALSRMVSPLGTMDGLVSAHGLAPMAVAQTESALLFEACAGRIMTEADLHNGSNARDAQAVGRALAQLHALQPISDASRTTSSPPNSLWKACDSMLDLCDADYSYQGWTLPRIQAIVQAEQDKLEALNLPVVACGHGDCKPGNIMRLQPEEYARNRNDSEAATTNIQFIDLELSGVHYRAFDLAKFFRSDATTSYTPQNQRAFYTSYLEHTAVSPTSLEELEREVKLLLPMTWLEAAIFFVCMACQDQGQSQRWNELAVKRFESYHQAIL
jgi:thiamine kinase-like enzyme